MMDRTDVSRHGAAGRREERLSQVGPRVAVFLLGLSALYGCGESPPPSIVEDVQGVEEEEAAEESAAPRVETVEVDFASLAEFPQLVHAASGNLEGGDVRYPLMEGETVRGASGEVLESYWEGIAPATFEISIPPGEEKARIREVRVTSLGGDRAFQECVVYIQPRGLEGVWRRPEKLRFEKSTLENAPGGPAYEHVFRFQPVQAAAVRIAFIAGCPAHPDRVYVEDIDVLGTSEREVE